MGSTCIKVLPFICSNVYRYEEHQEHMIQQNALSLYCITLAHKRKRILEAGTGVGLGARICIGEFMKKGAVYFGHDYSKEMCRLFTERFNSSALAHDSSIVYKHIDDVENTDFHQVVDETDGKE